MLAFNAEFQTGKAKISLIRFAVTLASGTHLSIDETRIMLGGFSRDTSTTIDGAFTIGAAVTGKITAIIDNSDELYSAYDFKNAVIVVSLGGELSDSTNQLLQVGIYTVDEYTYNGSQITLTAYDNLEKFDVPCSETTVTFPITLENLVRQACTVAGVTLANTSIPNGSYSITQQPPQWDTMTWHDVISAAAQIACCFARILPDGRLYFSWYDTSVMNVSMLDGGTFTTSTTPYSDGDNVDGGDFTYTEATSYDGGTFGDRANVHNIGYQNALNVDTDDVVITGISVTLAASDNIQATEDTEDYTTTLGSEGYVVNVSNNPLIETTANADAVCTYLNTYVTGMIFRPLTASIPENPSIEAGDMALVTDYLGHVYICFVSHVLYTTSSATSISCDAESAKGNLKARYTESQKTQALAQRIYTKATKSTDGMLQTILSGYATTMGLYQYTETQADGSTIYIYGNKNTLASSDIRWKFSAGAMMVSSDYGATWNGAITADGIAVLQEVYAVKVNADNILAGTITIGGTSGNTDGSLIIKDASNNTLVSMDKTGASFKGAITSGSTITGAAITVGGSGSAGSIIIKDSSNNTLASMDETGVSIKGSITSGSTITGTTISGGTIEGTVFRSTVGPSSDRYPKLIIDDGGLRIINNSTSRELASISQRLLSLNDAYNPSMGLYCGRYVDSDGNPEPDVELDIGIANNFRIYSSLLNRTLVDIDNVNTGDLITVYGNTYIDGNLHVTGTKNRSVKTEHYGTVGMNAFETASSHFADIGSGVVGNNGTALIYFDPVFAETIDLDANYQVMLTQTSKEKTEWVEKKDKYFIVHGEPGATFDWMLIGYQKGYTANRMAKMPDIKEN